MHVTQTSSKFSQQKFEKLNQQIFLDSSFKDDWKKILDYQSFFNQLTDCTSAVL